MPLITTSLKQVLSDLQQGKPVAIPTETVYGLAASIQNEAAIKAVFAMKNRPLDHPLIVHVAPNFDVTLLVEEIPDYAKCLIKNFWPGPLTLVLRTKLDQINPLITGGQSTVALRCPAHPLAQELLTKFKIPIVAPSANPFGKISPTTAQHVALSFTDKELTILDGDRCSVGIESTIIDASDPAGYQILRHGVIDEQSILEICGDKYLAKTNTTKVPGRLETHYQPQKPLYYFAGYESLQHFCQQHSGTVYVIASKKPADVMAQQFHLLSQQPEQAAFDLYYQLRLADESSATCIAIELPPDTSPWQGVRERVLKAGSDPYH